MLPIEKLFAFSSKVRSGGNIDAFIYYNNSKDAYMKEAKLEATGQAKEID